MKISVLLAQFPVSLSISENLTTILGILDGTYPGEFVVLPEGAVSGYSQDSGFINEIDHQVLNAALDTLREQAQQREIHLWVGACIPDEGGWYNVAVGFTPTGGAHQYRKINLANHERGVFTPGSDLPIFDVETQDGILKVGVQICREIRYPEQWGWLARQGAQVIFHLNNAVNDDRYLPVWRSHLVSHAAANQRYVISVNNAAALQTSPTIAVSPEGWVMAEIVSDRCESTRVELDLAQVSNWYLDQCRPDVVSIDVPSKRDRRKIFRSMKLEKLQKDLENLRGNPVLYEDSNLNARTEALEFINMIEEMVRLRPRDRNLQVLYQQALNLRQRLEYINIRIFTQLRGRIQTGEFSPAQLRAELSPHSDYKPENPGRHHYGYEDLDGLAKGVFLSRPVPEEIVTPKPGMVRYQPTPASVILELIDRVGLSTSDVFFDLGSGLGQVVGLVSALTGARCVGIEYQPSYCAYARQMAIELGLSNITIINTDAQDADFSEGTVFFLFNPFGGRIFDAVMAKLWKETQTHQIKICSYGSCTEPISKLPWLDIIDPGMMDDFKLAIFRSKSACPTSLGLSSRMAN